MALEEVKKDRLKKLANIKNLGIDPYPAKAERKQAVAQALDLLGKKVTVVGRIRSLRPHGKIAFADLEDESGKIQLLFTEMGSRLRGNDSRGSGNDKGRSGNDKKEWNGGGGFDFLNNLDLGDFLEASGEVIKTQAGQTTVQVDDFRLLTKSLRPLPVEHFGLKDTEERLRKRYLDLILNPEVKEMFRLKTKFWASLRSFLIEKGFLEVETPVLQAIPGGADARPFVTHHNAQDMDLYLRISLELPLKRLLVGGFEKVFEIGRIFRNEGIDDEHLQDYTQLEFYWAYADYNQLMDFVQEMYQRVISETFGRLTTSWHGHEINWEGDWSRMDYTQLLDEYWKVKTSEMSVDDLYELAKKLGVNVEPKLGKWRLLDYLYKKTIRPKIIQPMFVINHPVEVEPLAKRLESDLTKVQRMQVLATGSELGKGFSELNDPIDQKERFVEQEKLRKGGDEEAQMMDEDFVEALEYGMPPAAGFGISERLFWRLVDKTARECVFFPTMRAEKE